MIESLRGLDGSWELDVGSFGEEMESLSEADWALGERTSSFGFSFVFLFF